MPESLPSGTKAVKVLESEEAPGYTYLKVDELGNQYWIAVPTMNVEEGDIIYYSKSMRMDDFQSNSLDKTFDYVLFVEDASKTAPAPSVMMGQEMDSPHKDGAIPQEKTNVSVEPLKDGKTVEQVYMQKNSLKDKVVKIRGTVTKFNSAILNRNWIHIQDGTGGSENFDLLVTSSDEVSVGDVIVIEGKVSVDKDFGHGYSYPVMVEDAKIKKEAKI